MPSICTPAHSERRARALRAVARARLTATWLRLGAVAVSAVVTAALASPAFALVWFVGMVLIIGIEWSVYRGVEARCALGDPPRRVRGLIAWTALQAIWSGAPAVVLWFAPHVPAESLAVIYLIACIVNAAATMRAFPPIALVAMSSLALMLMGLPLAKYVLGGGRDAFDLIPLMGVLLLFGFAYNLWRGLIAADAAQARAEAAALREQQAAAAAADAEKATLRRVNAALRTPLAALQGAGAYLRSAARSAQARAHADAIVHAGETLEAALGDVCMPDAGAAAPTRADPHAIAREAANAFRLAAREKHIELFCDVAPETPAEVELDAVGVRQILIHLLANAVGYTTHGGVRLRVLAQPCGREGWVRLGFVVADTGQGLSRSQLALMLSESSRPGANSEVGAGLSASLRLARRMGATLSAKSELGQGAAFTLSLEAPVLAPARADAA